MNQAEKLPNLIIAGVSKAGTTSLFAYLSQHSAICPARKKELAYFTPLRFGEPTESLEEYARNFVHCGDQPYRVEATPNYFFGGSLLISRLHGTLPDAHIILSLRNPVERLWSAYAMKIRKGKLDRDATFDSFVQECQKFDASQETDWDGRRPYQSLSTGLYAEYLPLWADEFGDRLKILFFEQWTREPSRYVGEVFQWLGIDPAVAEAIDYRVRNQAAIHRSRKLWKVARAVNRSLHLALVDRQALKALLTRSYKKLNTTQFRERMRPETRAALEEHYREGNIRLAAQLSDLGYTDLPAWLTPEKSAAPASTGDQTQSKEQPSV